MKRRSLLSLTVRGFLIICLIDLVLIGVVVGIGWWTGWTDPDNFKIAIRVSGLLVIGLGLLGIKGNLDKSRHIESQNSVSGAEKDSWDRIQSTLIDLAQRFSYLMIMFIAGGVCLVISWLM